MSNELLHHAAQDGDLESVKRLIQTGADVNGKDNSGWTPLHRANYRGGKAIVAALIAAGADINAKDTFSRTPLDLAAEQGHEAVVAALIEAGADVNAKNTLDRTPLYCAVLRGHAAVVAALIEAGADVNVRDDEGRTPLRYAVNRVYNSVVPKLIAAGAHTDPDMWAEVDDGTKDVMLEALSTRLNGELVAADGDCERAVLDEAGHLTTNALDYAQAQLLPRLFVASRWRGREPAGLEFYDKLVRVIPDSLRAEVVPELDVTALRRAAVARAALGTPAVARYVRGGTSAPGPAL